MPQRAQEQAEHATTPGGSDVERPAPAPGARRRSPLSPYSRFVSSLKITLPMLAGGIVALLIVWPQLEDDPDEFHLTVSGIAVEESATGAHQVVKPRFTGIDAQQRPFTLMADAAIQPTQEAGQIELDNPRADVTLNENSWLALSAPAGTYSKGNERLKLSGGVDMFHDDGYELHTEAATIELDSKVAFGDRPVEGHGPLGQLNGSGFYLFDEGRRILFTGKSRLVLYPAEQDGKGR